MFEKRMLIRLVGPKRDEITQGWRELHNEESCNLYSLPNIIRMIKSKGIRWERHCRYDVDGNRKERYN
jgi:hypothetical protein